MDKNILEHIKKGIKPSSFDWWRQNYRHLSFKEQQEIYEAWANIYPNQGRNYCLAAVMKAIEVVMQKLGKDTLNIIELGGYQGELAYDVLTGHPSFTYKNYDFTPKAIRWTLERLKPHNYQAVLLQRPFWETPIEKDSCDLFITSHMLEHLKNAQVFKALKYVAGIPFLYIQMPIRYGGYMGVGAGHICSLSTTQLLEHSNRLGYKEIELDYLKRWEARMCKKHQNYTEIIRLLEG